MLLFPPASDALRHEVSRQPQHSPASHVCLPTLTTFVISRGSSDQRPNHSISSNCATGGISSKAIVSLIGCVPGGRVFSAQGGQAGARQ